MPQFAGGFDGLHVAAGGDEIVVVDGLRFDESPGDVAVDLAGGFNGVTAFLDRPGMNFRITARQKGNQAHRRIARLNEPIPCRRVDAEIFKESSLIFRRIEFGDLRFGFGADVDHAAGVLVSKRRL